MSEPKVITALKKKTIEYVRLKEELIRDWQRDAPEDWAYGCGQMWDLAVLHLVENDIKGAKELFLQANKLALVNNHIREDFPSIKKIQIETSICVYLGGNVEMACPFAEYILSLVGELEPTKESIKAFWAWQWSLLALMISDYNRLKRYLKYIEDIVSGYSLGSDGLPITRNINHYNYGYSIYGMNMIQGIISKNSDMVAKNIELYSQVLTMALKRTDTPSALADLELIVIYDLALKNGLCRKVITPFIPSKVLENGYWNKRT